MSIFFNLQSTSATSVYGFNGGVLDYNGYWWILGGSAGIGYGSTTRIMRSSDLGVTWELVTNSSNIGISNSSSHHATIVYGGYMWVIGGMWSGGTSNDYVRRTTDGISYTYLTYPDVGTAHAFGIGVCVHKGRLYMSGGSYYSFGSNNVHSTINGTTWVEHHANGGSGGLPTSFSFHVMYSFGGNLWIGTGNALYVSYDDGSNWSLYSTGVAPFNGFGIATGSPVAYGYVYVMRSDGLALYYSSNGGDFHYEPTSGTSTVNGAYVLSLNSNKLTLIGGVGNSGLNYGRTYMGTTIPHYNSTIEFDVNTIHSPSPAYLRLTDSSQIYDVSGGDVSEFTRIWSIVNNRTLEEILYSTSAAEFEIVLNGIAGDTFNVSLSAVF